MGRKRAATRHLANVAKLKQGRRALHDYLLLLLFLNPRKTRVGKNLRKLRKNGEANVPSGRPTQNYYATKQN